jgi:hypothetical protein
MFPLAVGRLAGGPAHWTVVGLEVALAVALFAAGVLIDRRASRRRRATAVPGLRAVPHQGESTSVTLQVFQARPAEAGDQRCGAPGR